MASYGLRSRDCSIGSLAAKENFIFTIPQKAGCNQHSRVVYLLLVENSTKEILHPKTRQVTWNEAKRERERESEKSKNRIKRPSAEFASHTSRLIST